MHAALKTAINEAQTDTAHGMPLLSAFGEEREFWERAQRDRRQQESHNVLLLAVKHKQQQTRTGCQQQGFVGVLLAPVSLQTVS